MRCCNCWIMAKPVHERWTCDHLPATSFSCSVFKVESRKCLLTSQELQPGPSPSKCNNGNRLAVNGMRGWINCCFLQLIPACWDIKYQLPVCLPLTLSYFFSWHQLPIELYARIDAENMSCSNSRLRRWTYQEQEKYPGHSFCCLPHDSSDKCCLPNAEGGWEWSSHIPKGGLLIRI